MPSMIDVTIATGLFIVIISFILISVLGQYNSFQNALENSDLHTSTQNMRNIIFSGKGFPENWETRPDPPIRIGLVGDLYRKPIIMSSANDLEGKMLNFTIEFDPSCMNTTMENTIRIYNESNHEYPYTLYNKTYCIQDTFLKRSDIVMDITTPKLEKNYFFIYHSPESSITGPNYQTLQFKNVTNYTVTRYPIEKLEAVSPLKVKALRNLTYNQIVQSLGQDLAFQLEIENA